MRCRGDRHMSASSARSYACLVFPSAACRDALLKWSGKISLIWVFCRTHLCGIGGWLALLVELVHKFMCAHGIRARTTRCDATVRGNDAYASGVVFLSTRRSINPSAESSFEAYTTSSEVGSGLHLCHALFHQKQG